ncbi:hypothetical protein F5141DRAFT_1068472 [Pisolithus sp. B1]|nr:hypothetical protein F5141DRAFT_1068472 [Pisolithus sp. B1]
MAIAVPTKVNKACPQLMDTQKSARRAKFITLTNDILEACSIYSSKVQTISKKHQWSEHWTCHQLYCLEDINEKLAKGLHWKLPEFIAAHWETLLHDFSQLTDIHKSSYVMQLMKECVRKQAVVHDQQQAMQCKMSAAFNTMDKELQWTSLCSNLGIKGFYIAGEKFVCSVLDLEPHHLALKFEVSIVSDLETVLGENCTHLMVTIAHAWLMVPITKLKKDALCQAEELQANSQLPSPQKSQSQRWD